MTPQQTPATRRKALENPHDVAQPPSPLPRTWQQAMLAVFLLGLLVSLGCAATEHWRRAAFLFGGSFLWLAAARALCEDSVIGLFSVRSRRFDVAFSSLLGAGLLFLSISVDALGS